MIQLWSHEYFIDKIERIIKNEIDMYFHVHHERKATKEEYEEYFDNWKNCAKCNVTNFDLGIYE